MAGVSHYEINVSLKGYHFFATAERSCTSRAAFDKVLKVIKEKFPVSEGYKIDARYWKCEGEPIDTE